MSHSRIETSGSASPTLRGWLDLGPLPRMRKLARQRFINSLEPGMQFKFNPRSSFSAVLSAVFSGALLSLSLAAMPASAGVIVSQLGTDDGFGFGAMSGDAISAGDFAFGDGFDEWHALGFSTVLNTNWSQPLVSARLDVFSGGWGLDGPAMLFVNQHLVGALTTGDGSMSASGDDYAFLDTFTFDPGWLNGADLIEIRLANPDDDGGVLGYLKLTLQTQDAGGGSTVPEPGSVALAGVAIAGALLSRRRRRD